MMAAKLSVAVAVVSFAAGSIRQLDSAGLSQLV
jgi:hypothetical protein